MIATILDQIAGGKRFLVASHESPDGDALASTLALTLALRALGKEVVAYNRDGVPEIFSFLPGAATVVSQLADALRFDVGFILDAGELRRAGTQLPQLCQALVNIDHHPHSDIPGALNYVDIQASATGVLIHRLLVAGGLPLTRDVAFCIYTAILSDTGSFRYSNADAEAFRVAGEMVALGINPWDVASNLYESQPEKRLRLLALALPTLTVSASGLYASITVTSAMLQQTGATAEHTDGFVNYPRSIHGVEVGLFFRQVDATSFKVGFRSKGAIDVGTLSRELGGGGHHNAAGAMVEGTLDEVRRTVFARIDQLLA
ncbi:MAG: phosphoesterase [Desulfuromonadales bacterium GWD2_61_12]|nr:MAG: phosphoesterase [Desulfuromonadales bacterium GWD2_61_12]